MQNTRLYKKLNYARNSLQPHATSRNLTQLHATLKKNGFTLLEVLVAIAVFGLVMAAAAGAFSSIQQAWRKQRNTMNLVQNSRWAMERMANEIRNSPGIMVGVGLDLLDLSNNLYYWRGDGGTYGNTSTIYRGTGGSFASGIPNNNRQELTNFIVDNPDLVNNTSGLFPGDGVADPVFIRNSSSAVLTITLTVRPQPTQPVGRENRDYTVRTQVRRRN